MTRLESRVPRGLWLVLLASLLAFVFSLAACGGNSNNNQFTGNQPGGTGSGGGTGGSGGSGGSGGGSGSGSGSSVALVDEVVAKGLTVPWAMVFAPDGRMFFTEQPGRLRVMANGQVLPTPVYDVTAQSPGGEAGMLGLALDPNFASNHFLYTDYCVGTSQNPTCRIVRLTESNNTASNETVLLEFPGGFHHNGARVKFGPDGLLYVTMGDASDPPNAQDPSVPEGKILRMNPDGSPAGSGFTDAYVYTMGHRNPQGLAFDSGGNLYETEHGPTSNDEVNLIQAGKNYGWPTCVGICSDPQFVNPIKLFSPETAAPSGATFYYGTAIPQWDGSLLFGTLGLPDNTFAHHLHRIKFDTVGGTKIVDEEVLYKDKYGRIRDVVEAPDGTVYFSSSNGGGTDVIVHVRPK